MLKTGISSFPMLRGNANLRRSSGIAASSLGSLIAAQMQVVDDVEERKKRRQRSFERGKGLLTILDEIKLELLGGGQLSPGPMLKLIATIEGRERDSGDPHLEEIVDEIELRARVELAKLRRPANAG
jgi:hypothetical protein